MRGSVEDYILTAKRLLTSNGRFILSFWRQNDSDLRIREAAEHAGMKIFRSIDVYMGDISSTVPHITVYELVHTAHMKEIQTEEFVSRYTLKEEWLEPFEKSITTKMNDDGDGINELKFLLNITKPYGAGYNRNFELIREKLLMK